MRFQTQSLPFYTWAVALLFMILLGKPAGATDLKKVNRARRVVAARARVLDGAKKHFQEKGVNYGAPIFIRVFKAEALLELWAEDEARIMRLIKTYRVCAGSGILGP